MSTCINVQNSIYNFALTLVQHDNTTAVRRQQHETPQKILHAFHINKNGLATAIIAATIVCVDVACKFM